MIRRRAAGEPFRSIAADYDVEHTTLVRYFARPEVAKQVKQMERQLRAEERARLARRSAEQRLEREVRRNAQAQVAQEGAAARRAQERSSPKPVARARAVDDFEAWLDERDARRPLTRADLYRQNDRIAAAVVAGGGGIAAVIEATGLRTYDNVVRLIDEVILKQAFDNDLLSAPSE